MDRNANTNQRKRLVGEKPYNNYIKIMMISYMMIGSAVELTRENKTWFAISFALLFLNFGAKLILDRIVNVQPKSYLGDFFVFASIASPYSLLPAAIPEYFNWQGYIVIFIILVIVRKAIGY